MRKRSWFGTRCRLVVVAGAALGVLPVRAGPALAQQQAMPALTLEEAIERALHTNPQLALAEAGVESAEWSQRRAGAAYLPNLSLNSGVGLSGTLGGGGELDAPVPGTRESYSAGASASVDLFTGGRRGAEVERARAESAAAQASLTERRFATVLAVQREFYEVSRAAELVAVAEARVEAAEQALAAAERRLRVGSATSSDVLRAELELSRARQALLEARNQERSAALSLGRSVGLDGPVGVRLRTGDQALRALEEDDAELVRLVVEAAPTLSAAAAALRSAEAGTRSAASQYLPRLQLSTGYDWSSQQFSWDAGTTGWGLRLGVSLPIFDGFQREASVAEARSRAATAALQLADAQRAVRVDAERLIAGLRLAEQRIALAENGVRVAEEDLRVQQTRYQVAASTMLDQLASQTALAEARQNLVAARYDYQIARAELEALAGRPL